MGERGKRGQLELSFGMIFSIILIVVFISVAVYGIVKFLEFQKQSQIGIFFNDFQSDIDKMWRASGSQRVSYSLPGGINSICFIDYKSGKRGENREIYDELSQLFNEAENLFFYPPGSGVGGLDAKEIRHINLEKITESENPFCIQNVKGRVDFVINNFDESLVNVVLKWN